jgi:hypothetical protein
MGLPTEEVPFTSETALSITATLPMAGGTARGFWFRPIMVTSQDVGDKGNTTEIATTPTAMNVKLKESSKMYKMNSPIILPILLYHLKDIM